MLICDYQEPCNRSLSAIDVRSPLDPESLAGHANVALSAKVGRELFGRSNES